MAKDVKGIAASDGIGIAPAYLLVDPDLSYDKVRLMTRRRNTLGLKKPSKTQLKN